MKHYYLPLLLIFGLFFTCEGQTYVPDSGFRLSSWPHFPSRYPDVHTYDERLTSLGNLWFYVERVDAALDSARQIIDSLRLEVKWQKDLLRFNTDMGNFYIRQVDSLIKRMRSHGPDTVKPYKMLPT